MSPTRNLSGMLRLTDGAEAETISVPGTERRLVELASYPCLESHLVTLARMLRRAQSGESRASKIDIDRF